MKQQPCRQIRKQYLGQTVEGPKGLTLDAFIRTQELTVNCGGVQRNVASRSVNKFPFHLHQQLTLPEVHQLGQSVGWIVSNGISTNGRGRRSGSPVQGSGMSPDGTDVFTRPALPNR